MNTEQSVYHYFVDEAGDLNLFDRKGRVLLGTAGVSNFFLVGVAYVPDPESARAVLETLPEIACRSVL